MHWSAPITDLKRCLQRPRGKMTTLEERTLQRPGRSPRRPPGRPRRQDGTCRGVVDTGTSHLGIPGPHDKVPLLGVRFGASAGANTRQYAEHGTHEMGHIHDEPGHVHVVIGLWVKTWRFFF